MSEIRYEEADENLTEVFLNVLEKNFPFYQNFKFKLLFDLKKRVSQGKLVLASIELPGPKLKFFSRDKIAAEGYDFIIIVDRKAWELSGEQARTKIIRHELRHVEISEDGSVKLVGHEIEDFYAEIEANKDDPEWRRKLVVLVNDVYEQEKIMLKEAKAKAKEKNDE
jgi:hypothetical protein